MASTCNKHQQTSTSPIGDEDDWLQNRFPKCHGRPSRTRSAAEPAGVVTFREIWVSRIPVGWWLQFFIALHIRNSILFLPKLRTLTIHYGNPHWAWQGLASGFLTLIICWFCWLVEVLAKLSLNTSIAEAATFTILPVQIGKVLRSEPEKDCGFTGWNPARWVWPFATHPPEVEKASSRGSIEADGALSFSF